MISPETDMMLKIMDSIPSVNDISICIIMLKGKAIKINNRSSWRSQNAARAAWNRKVQGIWKYRNSKGFTQDKPTCALMGQKITEELLELGLLEFRNITLIKA
jgi:hypothetical protein